MEDECITLNTTVALGSYCDVYRITKWNNKGTTIPLESHFSYQQNSRDYWPKIRHE